jgi:hypothetical protein
MGNRRRKRPRFPGLESPAIAHNDVAASAKFAAVEAPKRAFFGNRGSGLREIYTGPKKKFSGEPNERAQHQNAEQFSVELKSSGSNRTSAAGTA